MKRKLLHRYDKLLLWLVGLLLGATMAACDDPDQPAPEYGVQPMYGVQTATVEQHKTT